MLPPILLCICLFYLGVVPALSAGSKVTFDATGVALVDGKPFFPVGIYTYSLDDDVMAELHEKQFNTIITFNEAHRPDQLGFIRQHGLMAICPARQDWLEAARQDPSLLAWYLDDEPEGHGQTPASEEERYRKIKAVDPYHPIGLCHFLWESLEKYRDACDFTMTSVYPLTAKRDVPITHVGKFIDEARRIHGPGWPHWAYIQVFGGPQTEGGKWAQPLPHEVRCMAYIALVHRATGILYFSYWPKAPVTWASIGPLNAEIHRMTPWLVAPGTELTAVASHPAVQARVRKVREGGILILVNTGPAFVDTEVVLPGVKSARLAGLFEVSSAEISRGNLHASLGPFATQTYTWGRVLDDRLPLHR